MLKFTCDECGIKYVPERDISYHHKHFCSMKCKEDFIDDESAVGKANEPNGHDLQLSLNFEPEKLH